jgi:hypothetical protein
MTNLSLQEMAWGFLEKLYELSEGGLHPEVNYKQAQSELGYPENQMRGVVQYLQNKGLVSFECRVTCIRITSRGIDEVYQAKKFPDRPTEHFPANITNNNYTINVHGDNRANIQQGGQGNTQTQIVIGSDFEQAIKKLLTGIEQSDSLPPLQKIRTRGDIQTLNELALMEKTPEVVKEADTRVTAIQSVLSTTADLVSLGMVVIPIIRAAFGL